MAKSSPFNRDNREWMRLAIDKKLAAKAAPKSESWWIGKSRADFQAEVTRRHACILNSRNPSDRSLSKVV